MAPARRHERAETQCYALQSLPQLAGKLGATPDEAAAVARYALTVLDPQLPGDYHSPECRDGGALDLRRDDPAWPLVLVLSLRSSSAG